MLSPYIGQVLHRVPISRTLKWLINLTNDVLGYFKDTILFPTPKLVLCSILTTPSPYFMIPEYAQPPSKHFSTTKPPQSSCRKCLRLQAQRNRNSLSMLAMPPASSARGDSFMISKKESPPKRKTSTDRYWYCNRKKMSWRKENYTFRQRSVIRSWQISPTLTFLRHQNILLNHP